MCRYTYVLLYLTPGTSVPLCHLSPSLSLSLSPSLYLPPTSVVFLHVRPFVYPVFRYEGTLGHEYIGTLVHWCTGTLISSTRLYWWKCVSTNVHLCTLVPFTRLLSFFCAPLLPSLPPLSLPPSLSLPPTPPFFSAVCFTHLVVFCHPFICYTLMKRRAVNFILSSWT